MAYKEEMGNTSSDNYKMCLTVSYSDQPTSAKQPVELQLWIQKTDANYKRYRHNWSISYYVNNNIVSTETYVLPDDNATAGVVSAGYLNMTVGTWHKWGPSFKTDPLDNGQTHRFDVVFACGTVPRQGALGVIVTLPAYIVTPGKPEHPTTNFNTSTRVMTYSWNAAANADIYRVWVNQYNAAGVILKDLYGNPLSYDLPDTSNTWITQSIHPECVKITWQIRAINNTGGFSLSDAQAVDVTAANTKVWIKDGTAWRKTIPWVKDDAGKWHKVSKTFVKDAGNKWHQTIT